MQRMADTKPILGLLVLVFPMLAHAASVPVELVRIASGELRGTRADSTFAFLGVPYAASAGGNNRWRAPQPVLPWTDVREAKTFGADCPQGAPYTPPGGSPWTSAYFSQNNASEDCLFLNVWTPALRAGARLPVLVWIHGGVSRLPGNLRARRRCAI
jgi:para-nitrobenzyl esterase